MNKTDVFIYSGCPFNYWLFLQNLRKRMSPWVDKLHVYKDDDFYLPMKEIISRFYHEASPDIRIELTENIPMDLSYRKNYLVDACEKSETDVFAFMHEDVFVLNEQVFQTHVDSIHNHTYDIINNAFGCGSEEVENIVDKYYPKPAEIYRKAGMFRCLGLVDYWLVRTEMILETNCSIDYGYYKKGEEIPGLVPEGEPNWIASKDGYFESFTNLAVQFYKKGYQNVLPFSIEQDISVYDLDSLKNWEKMKKIGIIHNNGGRYAYYYIHWPTLTRWGFGDIVFNDKWSERLHTMTAFPILFFNFKKYPYLQELCYDVFVPAIKRRVNEMNLITDHNVKVNTDIIMWYGQKMELEIFPENIQCFK